VKANKGQWWKTDGVIRQPLQNNFKHNQYGVNILHYCNFHKSIYESFKKLDDN